MSPYLFPLAYPSLPPSLSHPSRWSQSTELISLCYAVASPLSYLLILSSWLWVPCMSTFFWNRVTGRSILLNFMYLRWREEETGKGPPAFSINKRTTWGQRGKKLEIGENGKSRMLALITSLHLSSEFPLAFQGMQSQFGDLAPQSFMALLLLLTLLLCLRNLFLRISKPGLWRVPWRRRYENAMSAF